MNLSNETRIDWQQVFTAHRRWLTTVLLARGVDHGSAEEVLQEVFRSALKGADRLRDPAKVHHWLYRIAVNSALHHRRTLGRRRKFLKGYAASEATEPTSDETDPLAWLMADEQQELVRQALKLLKSQDAEILLLKYTEDWSYREMANHLGLSLSAVESRLHRAREKMRRALARLAPKRFSRLH